RDGVVDGRACLRFPEADAGQHEPPKEPQPRGRRALQLHARPAKLARVTSLRATRWTCAFGAPGAARLRARPLAWSVAPRSAPAQPPFAARTTDTPFRCRRIFGSFASGGRWDDLVMVSVVEGGSDDR